MTAEEIAAAKHLNKNEFGSSAVLCDSGDVAGDLVERDDVQEALDVADSALQAGVCDL